MFREEDVELDFVPLTIPRDLSTLDMTTLVPLAQSLNIPVRRESSNRMLLKSDIVKAIENWLENYDVTLDSFLENDIKNILNASSEAIEMQLHVRYPSPANYANVLDDDASIDDKRAVLLLCLLAAERFQYWKQFNGAGIDEIKALVMDILHCRIRIKNSLLTELIKSLLARELTTEEKKRRVAAVQDILRDVYKTGEGVTSNISLNVNWKESKVEVTTINGNKLDKLKNLLFNVL